jgi:hypothetical protein
VCWRWCAEISGVVGMMGGRQLVIFFFLKRQRHEKENEREKGSVFCRIIYGRFLGSV